MVYMADANAPQPSIDAPPSRAGTLHAASAARLCLDFANTSSGRGSAALSGASPQLRASAGLVRACRPARGRPAPRASPRRRGRRRATAARVLRRALALREAIHAIGAALARGAPPPAPALAVLNRELAAAMAQRAAAPGGRRLRLGLAAGAGRRSTACCGRSSARRPSCCWRRTGAA